MELSDLVYLAASSIYGRGLREVNGRPIYTVSKTRAIKEAKELWETYCKLGLD